MTRNQTSMNLLTASIIKAAIAVHRTLGPGLLESVYERCMVIELRRMGHQVDAQVPVAIVYDGVHVHDEGFRMDLLVEGEVIVELKSCEEMRPVYAKQLLTHLRLSGKHVGLLINFNVRLLKDGIVRIVDRFEEDS